MTAPAESMFLGVVLERRRLDNPWQDHDWRLVAVIPGAPAAEWRPMMEGDGWTRFHAATLPLELHRDATEGYRQNLDSDVPRVFVVLRDDPNREVAPFLLTVCPFEASSYDGSEGTRVEGVPMPPEVATVVGDFVRRFHVERTFVKRRRTDVEGERT